MKGLSIEARVGCLVLVAAGLLAAFVFVLGGFRLGDGFEVFVDFDNPGNVRPGAPVAIGGMKIGTVEDIEFRGGALDPETNTRALIRMRLVLDEEAAAAVHEDCLIYVTSQSVLGEQIIAIDPGSHDRPRLAEGTVVRGVDPPRLDLALALGYELLDALVTGLRENRQELQELLTHLGGVLGALHGILVDNRTEIDTIISNVAAASDEATTLMRSLRTRVDGPEVDRIVRNLDETLVVVARDLEPILRDTRQAVSNLNETLETVGPEEREQIRQAIHDASELAESANQAVADAQEIVARVRRGEGTVGALVMDEEIYDDLQELIRDLKHNPWKFFWRE